MCLLAVHLLQCRSSLCLHQENGLFKYKDIEIALKKMRNFKTKTVPVIEETLSMIKRGKDKHKVPCSPSLYVIQKKCIFRIC